MIVVTGAGLIGGRIIAALSAASADIAVVESALTAQKRARWAGASIAEELTPDALLGLADSDPAFTCRVEAVIHTGAITDTWDRATGRVLDANYRFSARLLRWCLDQRIPLIYASSSAVYGMQRGGSRSRAMLSPYALSKLLVDHLVSTELRTASSPVTGLRFFNVYGPGEDHKGRMASVVHQFHQELRSTGEISVFTHPSIGEPGSQRRDLVHVDDVAAVALWFLGRATSGIYDIGTGTPTTYSGLAGLVLDHAGHGAVRHTPLPDHLIGTYQTWTEADLGPLRAAGYEGGFRSPEQGVPDYLSVLDREADLTAPELGQRHPAPR